MHLIVGLGNPDARYAKTRHNAGFMVVDRLADRHARGESVRMRFHSGTVEARIGSSRCLLMKPATYMNRSGQAVGEAARFFKADLSRELIVITDDVAAARRILDAEHERHVRLLERRERARIRIPDEKVR